MVVLIVGSFIVLDFNSENSTIKKGIQIIKNKAQIFAQNISLSFMPRFPQRLMYLAGETAILSQNLVHFSEKLNELMGECGCKYAESQCQQSKILGVSVCKPGKIKTFGDPCQGRKDIEDRQLDIQMKIEQFSYLQKLLKKEMEAGLEKELKTLRPEVAEELENNLNKLLELNQEVILLASSTYPLPLQCTADKCQATCFLGSSFNLEACINPGQQKPIEVIFEAGVGLNDLELGEIGIKNINLGLPEKIKLKNLAELSSFTISLPSVNITFPEITIVEIQAGASLDLSSDPIVFHPPSPTIPQPPLLELSCPKFLNFLSSNQWSTTSEQESVNYVEAEWYFQTFSWLSEKCQELPGMKDEQGIPTEKIEECFDQENVHLTIIQECDDFWADYDPESESPPPIPPICNVNALGPPSSTTQSQQRECQDLFEQENESIPSDCGLAVLEEKCEQLKKEGREEIPGPCKFLPLFTSQFPFPDPYEFSGSPSQSITSIIADFPLSMLGCSSSPPTLPKITFPDIIIPDIKLPHIKFLPFFDIKLPSFIFEDLILPDLDLCDLDNCANIFPDLKFQLPYLDIPEIIIPSIQLPDISVNISGVGVIKVPLPRVELSEIEYPIISLNFLQSFNLGKLITPELVLPTIELPKPKIHFAFSGLNIDLTSILLGLIGQFLPSYCIGIDFNLPIPLRIYFDDFYFTWPAFPRIPEIPFCENINDFCQKAKTNLKEVTDKVKEIENLVNTTFQNEIQAKLNLAAQEINKTLTDAIGEQLNQRTQKIIEEIEKHIQIHAKIEACIPGKEEKCLKIQPLSIQVPDIEVPGISLSEITGLPEEISIDWPPELKKIILKEKLTYKLPSISLSKLSYEKKISIKIPGFQMPSLTVTLGSLLSYPPCTSQSPFGVNPCPTGEIQQKLEEIKQVKDKIEETSKKIINILE